MHPWVFIFICHPLWLMVDPGGTHNAGYTILVDHFSFRLSKYIYIYSSNKSIFIGLDQWSTTRIQTVWSSEPMYSQVHMHTNMLLNFNVFMFFFSLTIMLFKICSRYKIYIEGSAWSVSEKYILACNSLTLIVKPRYYDFFTRGLMPVHHYWPIKEDDKCRSIKFAVDWGNSHKQKVTLPWFF